MARTDENSPNWGGARPNSGRRPVANGKLRRINIGLTEDGVEYLKETYGSRMVSETVRRLISMDILATEYGIDLNSLLESAISETFQDVSIDL